MDAEDEQEDDVGPLEQVSDRAESERECGAVAHRSAKAKRQSSDSMLEEYLRNTS